MTAYETRSHIGPDGKLVLSVPREYFNTDVRVLVEPARNGNGAFPPGTRLPESDLTLEQLRARFRETAGSIPDFPDVHRPTSDRVLTA